MPQENKPLTFILSDESLNSHGTRVLTAGVDLTLFKKNPIMLWNHFRTWYGKTDEVLPIGRWENVRKEGAQILADAVFDEKDEFAQKIKNKVEQQILKMASVGIDIITTSEDSTVLVQGQTRPTIVKCLLKEASICDIASNRNALRLYDEFGDEIKLSDAASNHLLPLLTKSNQPENKNMNLKDVTEALGLKEATDESQLLANIRTIVKENQELKTQVQTFGDADKARKIVERDAYLKDAVVKRKITQSQVAAYQEFYDANAESTRSIIDALSDTPDLSDVGKKSPEASAVNSLELRKQEVANKLKQR